MSAASVEADIARTRNDFATKLEGKNQQDARGELKLLESGLRRGEAPVQLDAELKELRAKYLRAGSP